MADQKYNNLDEALDHARRFPITIGRTFVAAIVLEHEDGSFETVERPSNPCWGFLRSYQDGSTRPNDPWPGDLRADNQIFPKEGKPVALSVKWVADSRVGRNSFREYLDEILLNPETSPWRNLLKDVEVVLNDVGDPVSLLFKDTKIDPTLLVSFLRSVTYQFASSYLKEKKLNPDASPIEALMLAMFGQRSPGYRDSYSGKMMPGRPISSCYALSPTIEPKRFFNGNPYDLSNGGTFESREDYNRPEVDFVFGGRKTQEGYGDAVVLYNELGKVPMEDRLSRLREFLS